jgi:hypothetical protein
MLPIALAEKDPNALPFIAKRNIRENWDNEKDSVTKVVKDELLGADVKLMADYDAIWKTIAEAKKVCSYHQKHRDLLECSP